jgi:hypothetical protein
MIKQLRNFYRAVNGLPEALRRLEIQQQATLAPVDRYLALERINRVDSLFGQVYDYWLPVRLDKIMSILGGPEYFKGKRVLELGAGHCDIGAFFAELGAEVLCLEGRTENVVFARVKHRNVSNLRIDQFDLEKDFSEFGHFDVLINFALLMHLQGIEAHLQSCFTVADNVILETIVADSSDPEFIEYFNENAASAGNSVHGFGAKVSPAYIEQRARNAGFDVHRHFDGSLNVGNYLYDWKPENTNADTRGRWWLRRFWYFSRAEPVDT